MHVRSSAQCSKNGQLQIAVYAAYDCIHKFPFGFQAFPSWAQSLLMFLNSSKLQLILNWTRNFKAAYRISFSSTNSVDLKIVATSAQLLFNKVLPSMVACSSILPYSKKLTTPQNWDFKIIPWPGCAAWFAATIAILVVYREATQIENNSASILFTIAYTQNAFSVESPSLSTGNVFDFIKGLAPENFELDTEFESAIIFSSIRTQSIWKLWQLSAQLLYRISFSSTNSVDLKIVATSAQLLFNKVLPSMVACSSTLPYSKKLTTPQNWHLKIIQWPGMMHAWFAPRIQSVYRAASQIANSSASIKFGKPSWRFQK